MRERGRERERESLGFTVWSLGFRVPELGVPFWEGPFIRTAVFWGSKHIHMYEYVYIPKP